ncbi:hypothetical protein M407DRAFT_19809 [Tulasnella calospora MUT 4182]|uniref:F-box domain-containing protein n=1 Tax=Tulasnella calospora MUT 4182 TaxID=1051891 RepID=A0A0C3LBD5_9AGAM|nr:hypothetical protein M407DRAFT_19809 [Tulasnella calospora MUT 4182]
MSIPGDGLNGLPSELICNIFRRVVDSLDPREDRCRLMLVCRRWREYVEGSTLLWTTIPGRYGLTYMRRALENSRGAMIDLRCQMSSAVKPGLFMVEAGPHIARWRSLVVALRSPPPLQSALAPLTTTQAPNLELLKILMARPSHLISETPITLFGGAPAPSTLKDLVLTRVPVAIEPLGLSGLVSLVLRGMPTISTPQLFEILRGSPRLETLRLYDNPKLVAIGSQASNIHPIELPKLISLTLNLIDSGGTNCILSNIRLPNRRHVLICANMRGVNPRSVLFTSAITHLFHTTIPTADLPPSVIRVETYGDDCMITFRDIAFNVSVDGENRIQEILGWLADALGSKAAEFPVHLIHGWSARYTVRLAAVPLPFVVKHLSIPTPVYDPWREALYTAMAQAPDPPSSDWFIPQLESLSVGLKTMEMESQKQLISMLKNRYEGANSTGETELRCPMNLRSVELRGEARIEGLAEEIKGILGGVDVFWISG